jgi:hypothetical protein
MALFYHRYANLSRLTLGGEEVTLSPLTGNSSSMWKLYKEKDTNLLKEIHACHPGNTSTYANVELSCLNHSNVQFN